MSENTFEEEIDWRLVAEELKSRLVLVISSYEEQLALSKAQERQHQQISAQNGEDIG